MFEIEFLVNLLYGIGGLVGGAFFKNWLDRGIPLLTLKGFCTFIEPSTIVEYDEKFEQSIDQAWNCYKYELKSESSQVRLSTTTLGKLYNIWSKVQKQQIHFNEAKNLIPQLVNEIKEINEQTDWEIGTSKSRALKSIKDVVFILCNNQSLSWVIDSAIANNDLSIDYECDTCEENLQIKELKNEYAERIDAFYEVAWTRTVTYIGRQCSKHDFLKKRFQPYVNLLRSLEPKPLVTMLDKLYSIVQEQLDDSNNILEYTKELIETNKQWAGRVCVENYGKSSIIISPNATLLIDDSEIKLPCSIILEERDNDEIKLSFQQGEYVLTPGEKAFIWITTQNSQITEDDRENINNYYTLTKKREALIKLNLKVIGTIRLLPRSFPTNKIEFASNIAYPKYPVNGSF